ncbi:hypothetical protein AAF712_014222 [Marasmius tenuissimus]|uniref:F-box domain-containing protein n=1 Tax=Marasmius tenuissimus TaxID=585030 RepID=A0ABR2ZCQ1_9AGAR
MQIIDLPVELLSSLPLYIRNIEDFVEFSSTCRTIYNAFSLTHPNTILRLAAASAPTFFHPHPHFLIMATARQVSDWARGNPERTEQLQAAFRGGVDGLLELCLCVGGLTIADIGRLHQSRFSIINPLSDAIDKMAGNQWYSTPNFWDGGVSEPNTIYTDADRATFQIIIYGELFGSSMDAYLDGEPEMVFDLQVRLDYIKYCIPDWICEGGYPGLEVLAVGPYVPNRQERSTSSWRPNFSAAYSKLLSVATPLGTCHILGRAWNVGGVETEVMEGSRSDSGVGRDGGCNIERRKWSEEMG